MKTKAVKSIARFAVVLMVLSIIPSGAFAAEDEISADDMTREGPGNMMKGRMGHMGPEMGSARIPGMGMVPLEYADDEYFPEIQAAMLECLDQQIERMSDLPEMPEPEDLPEGVDEEAAAARAEARAEANAEKLAELEALYTKIENAESLDDLKAIAFSNAVEGMSDAIDMKIERLETMVENLDSEDADYEDTRELLESAIDELEGLKDQLDSAEDREALQEIEESMRTIMESCREEAGIEQEERPAKLERGGTSMRMPGRMMPLSETDA